MVWYSHLLKNFPQFVVIHTVKGFGIVSKAEVDVFLELSCFLYDPADVGNLMPGSTVFSKSSLYFWEFMADIHINFLLGCCCCSVTRLCLTLCDPMNCSMSGFHVFHYLSEFAQTHVHRVSDAIHLSNVAFNIFKMKGSLFVKICIGDYLPDYLSFKKSRKIKSMNTF